MTPRRHPEFRDPVHAEKHYLRLHRREPDYCQPPLEIPEEKKQGLIGKLAEIYGPSTAEEWYPELERRMRVYYAYKTPEMIEEDTVFQIENRFTEKDIILITYGDLIVRKGEHPLKVLAEVLNNKVQFATTIHILPFFPYSSDRGFSIKSYFEVDPNLGTWTDIDTLATRFQLMFDGVINHISAKSHWFQEFLNGNPEYEDYFIRFSTHSAISQDHLNLILRPRTSDLLTHFDTIDGPKLVWTTFSPDQIDLNYKNIKVLMRVLEVLLFYVRRGSDIIRLDAVTYLWSELGTSCAHLQQTHQIIQLFRLILDIVSPQVALITETNVPHKDNISYFGDGTNEAQMIYNFALPPLTLYTFLKGDCTVLSEWADKLEWISPTATYFNFLDSHDGVGLLPVKNLLDKEEIDFMLDKCREHGGMVSFKADSEGGKSPYELNITWYSALNRENTEETRDLQISRFVASRSIALALMGVPGIYLPSLIGHKNDIEAVTKTGEARSINRRTFDADLLLERLEDSRSLPSRILLRLGVLFSVRVHCAAFHPNGPQKILKRSPNVFSLVRRSPDEKQEVLCLTNVTAEKQEFILSRDDLQTWPQRFENIFTGLVREVEGDEHTFHLRPYEVKWVTGGSISPTGKS